MSNDDNPTSLKAVALRAQRVTGVTVGRALEKKAEEAGAPIGRETWYAILRGDYDRGVHRPSGTLLENLAKVSNLHPDKVRIAAGVPQPGAPFADDLPEDADYITGTPREILISAIRLFAQQSRRTAELEAELEELRNDDRSTANTDGDDDAGGGVVIDLPTPPKPPASDEKRAANDDEDEGPDDPDPEVGA